MKRFVLITLIIFQLFSNGLLYSFVKHNNSYENSGDVIGIFFDVIRSVVNFSGISSYIRNGNSENKELPKVPVSQEDSVYLVLTLNTISSLTIIFLQSMLVFLGFVNLLRVRRCKVGGRRYILMFLLFLPLSMYKFVYYAPRSSISDCVIYLISGVLISSRVGGMKLESYRRDGKSRKLSRLLRDRRDGCVDDIKHSYLLFANHQTLISNTYFLTPNYKPLVPNICRFNSASWFFTPYHPLVPALTFREYGINPPYHEAGLNLQKKSGVRNQRLGNKGFVAVAFMRPRKLRGAINRTATENETPQLAGRPRVGSGY